MKILFIGNYDGNEGPINVNKTIVNNADSDLIIIKSKIKILKLIEIIIKLRKCDAVLLSGLCGRYCYRLIKKSDKNFFYLMHGCLEYENEINHLGIENSHSLIIEKNILKYSKKIICVSEKYSDWVKKAYPDLKDKINFVNNGIFLKKRKMQKKDPYSIAVSGGNRCIKNNQDVYKAVCELKKEGINCTLYVFGPEYVNNDSFIYENDVIKYGQLEKDEYYNKLDGIACFILNSELESFGLVAADALNCNCSFLFSKNVGFISVLHSIHEDDVINNPHDIEELKFKIKKVLLESNSRRIYDSILIDKCNDKTMYNRIKSIICEFD